ncbi:MAG: FAD-binding protein [Rhodospirillaceae bacterium]|jgi:D-lactate dehydrogenase (cytochrome)|nr:FAD-binding protein [Rhodospirillaceae bacterium]MBT5245199.1 FAD-binding protein [Rhodospirillaceae bacterium]MBT5561925.1 FAD-binding protein [Rhodospirillaceae bacterium]MBT6241957.1 FAD-binding protein [Rhodospirillaceae bacterium]MBT7138589.1 FAD-binding protein [Rhodospirillaceae bacterium]
MNPEPPSRATVSEGFIEDLRSIVGDRLSTGASVCEQHGQDLSYHTPSPPDVVVFAISTQEVSAIVKLCAASKVPVIPYGAGTSLEGHLIALRGGVSIDLSQMNEVVSVNADDMDVVVQAGVSRKQLNQHLHNTGLFFPVDPGADASLGGMVATRASGTNAVRYGTMRENVLALTVVMADGRIVHTGSRARKSSTGYDLTHLMVGSEGTLGVVTEVTLKLHGIAEATSAAVVPFETLEGAVNTVIQTIQFGVPIARIELLDEVQVKASNLYSKTDNPEQPTLFLEFNGSEASVKEQTEQVRDICDENGGGEFRWSTRHDERDKLWEARHNVAYANMALMPGCKIMVTDACVPISNLAACLLETRKDIDESGMFAPIVGHVGDGNFHLTILLDPDDDEAITRAHALNDRMIKRVLDMGGTSSGEHGVGMGKIEYMEDEHGEGVAVMRQIKQALDPQNIMNPGKILPAG